jgi:hypothetical protein
MPIATVEQLNAFAAFPSHIASTIEGLTEAQLLYAPQAGEWSIHEVIVHLADSEAVGFWRIRKTLAEHEPELAVYGEATWASALNYRQQDHMLALRLFTDLRAANAALLRLIPQEAWERIGIHAERGPVTVYDLFMTYYGHGENHLQQIEHIIQTIRAH